MPVMFEKFSSLFIYGLYQVVCVSVKDEKSLIIVVHH